MMSPTSDLLFAWVWGSQKGRSPPPHPGKKEIAMTKETQTDVDTVAGADTGTGTDTDADTGADTGADTDTDTDTGTDTVAQGAGGRRQVRPVSSVPFW